MSDPSPQSDERTKRRSRVAKGVVAALILSIVGLAAWNGPAFWRQVATPRRYFEGNLDAKPIRGWVRVWRWSGERHGRFVAWYVDSGLKAGDGIFRDGQRAQWTEWHPDGSVDDQKMEDGERRDAPPWLWGVTDQTVSSVPGWILDDTEWRHAMSRAPYTP